MNCPKCGNYVDDSKEYCFMCGTKLNKGGFSSGNRFNENPSLNEDYYRKKEEYKNRMNNYRNVEIKRGADEKKDIFDLYAEHEVAFKIVCLSIAVVIGLLIYFKLASTDQKDTIKKPLLQNLYFKVSEEMEQTSSSNGSTLYSISDESGLGITCSLQAAVSVTNSNKEVEQAFENVKLDKTKDIYDDKLNLNGQEVPLFQNGEIELNHVKWYYLNVLYNKSAAEADKYTNLKERYLATSYSGYFYALVLTDNSSTGSDASNHCQSIFDSFLRSVEFVEATEAKK